MSFLDCMSCGFGAVILFFMIINSHVNATTENDNSELMAETNRLEIEVLDGRKNLALARNTKQKLEVEKEDAESKIAQIIALIQELQAELDKYDKETLAKIERVEKLLLPKAVPKLATKTPMVIPRRSISVAIACSIRCATSCRLADRRCAASANR